MTPPAFGSRSSRLPICGGNWNNAANAGVFNVNLNNPRSNSNDNIGFRPALLSYARGRKSTDNRTARENKGTCFHSGHYMVWRKTAAFLTWVPSPVRSQTKHGQLRRPRVTQVEAAKLCNSSGAGWPRRSRTYLTSFSQWKTSKEPLKTHAAGEGTRKKP